MDAAGAIAGLKTAVAVFRERDQDALTAVARGEELRDLRSCIDALELEFSSSARKFQVQGGHVADGAAGVVSWLSRSCGMSGNSAADRVCVGKELESLPKVAEALASGLIGYQSAAVLCHLRDQLDDKRDDFDEEMMLGFAREHTVANLRLLCRYALYASNPDGFEREREFDFGRRRLHISAMDDGMHVIDAVLDPVGGAAVKAALEALATSGAQDERKHSQRMADALVELTHHAMDSGRLPARRGVKPLVSVTTTLESLRALPGAPASDLELSLPIAQATLDRIACDCTISRVMLADSVVIDVGRATRTVSPATRRALQQRDRHCRWPGCDRPASWATPHHIELWSRGGPTKLPNLVLLCHFHHRLVHEGGWQVVRAGEELRFIPPERPAFVPMRARGPGRMQAA